MPISALPTPPSRSDAPQDFSDRADALLGALPGFVTEANALQSDVNAKEASASSYATIATDKAAEAQGHATTAGTKASEAAASAVAAAAAASNAEIAFDSFDDKYLGSKAVDPATDNDGNPLLTGALYWNTSVGAVRVWNGSAWLSMAADASIVDFQQAGAGAVVRTAQDKMREWVSATDFGADPSGVTDSTAAIQAALAAHDHVLFHAGQYKISGTISLKSGNVLLGAGYSNTRIFRDTAVTPFDYFEGITVSSVKVSGIHFDGVEKLGVSVAANRYCALRFWDNGTGNRSKDAVVEDCKFTYFTAAEFQPEGNRGVIALHFCDDAVVRGCWFEDNRSTCVFYGSTKNLRVLDNHCIGEQAPYDLVFQPTQGVGSFCSGGSEGCIIMGNRMRDTGYTSINCGGDGSVIANNVIRNPSYSGITINEGSSNPARDIVITGNSIRDTYLSGISIFNTDGFVIDGNSVVNARNAGNGQIRLFPTADNVAWPKNGRISNNYIAGGAVTPLPGIRVNAGENITVSGNTFFNNISGMYIQATNDAAAISLDILGNVFKDNLSYAVETASTGSAAQLLNIDQNTVISSDIANKQATGFVINGAVSTARFGQNTFSSNYSTNLIETSFANRATKAVLALNAPTIQRMKLLDTINYIGSATYDPASLASGSGVTTTVSVPGAEVGDIVDVAFSTALAGVNLWGWVSGQNVVSVRFHNQTGAAVDLGSGTLTVRVRKV